MQQLLEAALLKKPQALASWRSYLQQTDLQTLDHARTTLLPLIYRNLGPQSHPLCKSMYCYTWAFNQTLWKNTQPFLQKLLDAGVEKVILLKGIALILGHYHDFGVRVLGDLDILIAPEHLPLACSVLLSSGWVCTLPRFDPYSLHQQLRWNAAPFEHPSGLHLDLHWSLLLESSPDLDNAVWQKAPLGIHPADPTFLFLQTCVHGYKKSSAPLIRWIPDAITLLRSPIDFPSLFDWAKKTHLSLSFGASLAHLTERFALSLPPFFPEPTPPEIYEFRANMRGSVYLAGYYRNRLRKHSLLYYLQHTANLASPWHIPLYAPYWLLKRLYRLLRKGVLLFFRHLLP